VSADPNWLSQLSLAVRESTLKRLRLVPEGRENWRPSTEALSFADIAHHLIECDEWLFRKLTEPNLPSITAKPQQAVVAQRADFDLLVQRLAHLGERRAVFISALSIARLSELLPDDRFSGDVPVWWVIARGNLDHEAHHRGQLATYLRSVASARWNDA
jgi:uncharacterized damage-inducible protein DinB